MGRKEKPKSLTTKKQIPYPPASEAKLQLVRPALSRQGSKLKKRKGVKKHEFKEPKEPLDFKVLEGRFAKMWNEDEVEVNRLREKVCLLNYKNQNASYNAIYKEGSNAFQEIKPSQKKPQELNSIKIAKPRKSVPESSNQ